MSNNNNVSMERLERSDCDMDEVNELRTLRFNDPSGRDMQMVFGFRDGEPVVAVFRQLSPEEVVDHNGDAMLIIPRQVLQVALDQGWITPASSNIH